MRGGSRSTFPVASVVSGDGGILRRVVMTGTLISDDRSRRCCSPATRHDHRPMAEPDLPLGVLRRLSQGATRLWAWREHSGLSLEAVAKRARMEPDRLWELEGGALPGSDERQRLARIYGVRVKTLFGGGCMSGPFPGSDHGSNIGCFDSHFRVHPQSVDQPVFLMNFVKKNPVRGFLGVFIVFSLVLEEKRTAKSKRYKPFLD